MIEMYLPKKCYSKNQMKSVDGAVIHYISARYIKPDDPFNRDEIIKILSEYGFSYHYLVERDGTIINLVPGMHKAYHAGKSIMNGREGCNDFTVGIALAGGNGWPYTDEQIIEHGKLLIQLMTEHRFNSDYIQGHDQVRDNWNDAHPEDKRDKKHDPGLHYNWEIVKDMVASVSMQIKYEQSLG